MNINKSFFSRFAFGLVIVVFGLSSWLMLPQAAYAQTGTTPQPNSGAAGQALTKAYQREQSVLQNQTDALSKVNNMIAKAQDTISQA